MVGFWRDVRQAARSLSATPSLVVAAVLTLSLAVGTTATVLAMVDGLLFPRPAGVDSPARVVRLSGAHSRGPAEYDLLRRHVRSLTPAAESDTSSVPIGAAGDNGVALVRYVSANYFSVLGARPHHGRWFLPADGPDAVVLSYRLWSALGAPLEIIGSGLRIGGRPYTVIGVAAHGFRGAGHELVDVWLSAADAPLSGDGRFWTGGGFHLLGRLADGTSLAAAEAEIRTLYRSGIDTAIDAELRALRAGAVLTPLYDSLPNRLRALNVATVGLIGAALAFFVIACTNVSGVFAVRLLAQRRDLAVRVQLGATRGVLLRQLFAELLLLYATAAGAALIVASWATRLLESVVRAPLPGHGVQSVFPAELYALGDRTSLTDMTGDIAGYAAILAIAGTCVTLVIPGLLIWQTSFRTWLHRHPHAAVVPLHAGARRGPIIVQVALALVLIVAAGLFLRSLQNAMAVNFGVNTDNVYVIAVEDAGRGTPDALPQIADAVRSVAGVTHVTLSFQAPIGAGGQAIGTGRQFIATRFPDSLGRSADMRPPPRRYVEAVSPGYFDLLGIPVLSGRGFSGSDPPGQLVAIVNKRIADEFFHGMDPLGRCVEIAFDAADPERLWSAGCRRIVGVVGSVRSDVFHPGDVAHEDAVVYVPVAQWFPARHVLVRTATDAAEALRAIELQLLALASVSGGHVRLEPLSRYHDHETHGWRLGLLIAGAFGLVALVFASIGVYVLLAFVTSQRRHEIGVRLALGARPTQIARMTAADGMRPVGIGTAIGLAAAAASARLLEAALFGIAAHDPATYSIAVASMLLVGLLACLPAAVAAGRVDPAVQLRRE